MEPSGQVFRNSPQYSLKFPKIPNPKPRTLNPKPPKPETLNPQTPKSLKTLNPKPLQHQEFLCSPTPGACSRGLDGGYRSVSLGFRGGLEQL